MSFTEWGTQILLAMDEGIPVFNDGFFSECVHVYRDAAIHVLDLPGTPDEVKMRLKQALSVVDRPSLTDVQRALEIRQAFDFALAHGGYIDEMETLKDATYWRAENARRERLDAQNRTRRQRTFTSQVLFDFKNDPEIHRIWTTHTDHTDNGLSECRLEADAKERALRICGTLVVLTESQLNPPPPKPKKPPAKKDKKGDPPKDEPKDAKKKKEVVLPPPVFAKRFAGGWALARSPVVDFRLMSEWQGLEFCLKGTTEPRLYKVVIQCDASFDGLQFMLDFNSGWDKRMLYEDSAGWARLRLPFSEFQATQRELPWPERDGTLDATSIRVIGILASNTMLDGTKEPYPVRGPYELFVRSVSVYRHEMRNRYGENATEDELQEDESKPKWRFGEVAALENLLTKEHKMLDAEKAKRQKELDEKKRIAAEKAAAKAKAAKRGW